MLPVESVSDLFLYKAPDSPTSRVYTIRPYLPSDQKLVYEVCFKNYENHIYLDEHHGLVGDKYEHTVLLKHWLTLQSRYVGGFLTLSSEYCFVVEDDIGLCGYALAVLDAKNYFSKLQVSWIPEIIKKYPLPLAEEQDKQSKYLTKFLNELHNDHKKIYSDPETIFKNHPSLLNLTVMSSIMDLSVPKRMLACVIAALKANGRFN